MLDCQSFFLRHTNSGKCITVSRRLVYDVPFHALPYFVVMTDNCLARKAQFRYLESELLHNIQMNGTLVSPPDGIFEGRCVVYKGVGNQGKNYQRNLIHCLKQTPSGSLFFYKMKIFRTKQPDPVCAEPNISSKYLMRKTYCNTAQQEFTFGKKNIRKHLIP